MYDKKYITNGHRTARPCRGENREWMIGFFEWLQTNWGIFVTLCTAIGGVFKIYYDHLGMKREMISYQTTTSSVLKALEAAKAERHKEVERKFSEQERLTALEIKNAALETEKKLADYRHQNDKRMEEQGKLIQQLLLDTKENGSKLEFISQTLTEIKDHQKDNQKFREDFYRDQAQKR